MRQVISAAKKLPSQRLDRWEKKIYETRLNWMQLSIWKSYQNILLFKLLLRGTLLSCETVSIALNSDWMSS